MAEVIVNAGDIVYICNVCSKSTIWQNTITEHMIENHSFTNEAAALRSVTSYVMESSQDENKSTDIENNIETKVWNSDRTKLLINLVKQYETEFQTKMKKTVWQKICTAFCTYTGVQYSWTQCDTKWKGLQRTCKDIKLHNSTSGKARKAWEFYDVMNDVLHKKPEITAVATCSSHEGLVIKGNKASNTTMNKDNKGTSEDVLTSREAESTFQFSFQRKRKTAENAVERRHKEKLERMDRYLETLEKLVSVIEKGENKSD